MERAPVFTSLAQVFAALARASQTKRRRRETILMLGFPILGRGCKALMQFGPSRGVHGARFASRESRGGGLPERSATMVMPFESLARRFRNPRFRRAPVNVATLRRPSMIGKTVTWPETVDNCQVHAGGGNGERLGSRDPGSQRADSLRAGVNDCSSLGRP